MYNPYNWTITPAKDKSKQWEKTWNKITKLCTKKNVAKIGLNLAIMDLIDSLNRETENFELYSYIEHDIEKYLNKREEYKNICDELEHQREIIKNIF